MDFLVYLMLAIASAWAPMYLGRPWVKPFKAHYSPYERYANNEKSEDGLAAFGMDKLLAGSLVASAVAFVMVWLSATPLNVTLYGPTQMYLLAMFPVIAGFVLRTLSENRHGRSPADRTHGLAVSIVGVLMSLNCVAAAFSTPLVRAGSYQQLLGKPVNEGMKLPHLQLDRAPLVNESMALQEAQKLLSQDPGLGSQVTIEHMYKQNVRGKLVWVGFMEHSSFSRWLTNRYTPGYAVVSATDPSDAHLVTGLKLRYLDSAWFLQDIQLHAQLAMPSTGLEDFSQEIDDAGKPYWVITEYKAAVGTLGRNPVGTLLVDPVTGQMRSYSIANTPAWVDRIQPESNVASQVESWGQFGDGYWNSVLSGMNVMVPSSSPELVYGDDHHAYWYVGLTSTGRDNGIVGFLLVDSRTKKAYRYELAGADEEVATAAVEGLVRANKYQATNPVVFLVEGTPTYVMALTDLTGIVRGYGLVNVHNYQVSVQGPTLDAAVQAYANALQSKGEAVSQKVERERVTGVILRKQADVQNGSTTYYLVIQGVSPIITATSALSSDVPVLEPGDKVEVTYAKGASRTAMAERIALVGTLQTQ